MSYVNSVFHDSHSSMLLLFCFVNFFTVCGHLFTRVDGVSVNFYLLLHIMQLFSCVAYWMCITWQLFVLQAIPVVCVEAAAYCLSLMLWFVVSLVLNSACEVIAYV